MLCNVASCITSDSGDVIAASSARSIPMSPHMLQNEYDIKDNDALHEPPQQFVISGISRFATYVGSEEPHGPFLLTTVCVGPLFVR